MVWKIHIDGLYMQLLYLDIDFELQTNKQVASTNSQYHDGDGNHNILLMAEILHHPGSMKLCK